MTYDPIRLCYYDPNYITTDFYRNILCNCGNGIEDDVLNDILKTIIHYNYII